MPRQCGAPNGREDPLLILNGVSAATGRRVLTTALVSNDPDENPDLTKVDVPDDQKDRHIPNEQLGRIIALPKLISAIRVRSEIYGAIWWN